jgi:hypothetical protein
VSGASIPDGFGAHVPPSRLRPRGDRSSPCPRVDARRRGVLQLVAQVRARLRPAASRNRTPRLGPPTHVTISSPPACSRSARLARPEAAPSVHRQSATRGLSALPLLALQPAGPRRPQCGRRAASAGSSSRSARLHPPRNWLTAFPVGGNRSIVLGAFDPILSCDRAQPFPPTCYLQAFLLKRLRHGFGPRRVGARLS